MIHLFNGKKRILFFPVGFANSVARWILGVHSPSGTISIKNTATPGDNGSIALDVNVDALRRIMAGVIDDHDLTEREIKRTKDIVHGAIDGTSLIMGGEHISVSMDWLQQNILKFIGDDTEITHDKISDWDTATANFLTDADMSAYALDADLALLEQDVAELADYVESMDQDIADLTVWYGTGIGGSFNIVTNVEWTGSVLRMSRKSVTFTNGLITAIGNDSTVTIDTPVLFEQS